MKGYVITREYVEEQFLSNLSDSEYNVEIKVTNNWEEQKELVAEMMPDIRKYCGNDNKYVACITLDKDLECDVLLSKFSWSFDGDYDFSYVAGVDTYSYSQKLFMFNTYCFVRDLILNSDLIRYGKIKKEYEPMCIAINYIRDHIKLDDKDCDRDFLVDLVSSVENPEALIQQYLEKNPDKNKYYKKYIMLNEIFNLAMNYKQKTHDDTEREIVNVLLNNTHDKTRIELLKKVSYFFRVDGDLYGIYNKDEFVNCITPQWHIGTIKDFIEDRNWKKFTYHHVIVVLSNKFADYLPVEYFLDKESILYQILNMATKNLTLVFRKSDPTPFELYRMAPEGGYRESYYDCDYIDNYNSLIDDYEEYDEEDAKKQSTKRKSRFDDDEDDD